MTIREMQKEAASQGAASGWNDRPIEIPEMVALLHSEASEALESWRKGEPIWWIGEGGKPEGVAAEIADILIRAAHYAELLSFDLEDAVEKKMKYNKTRPYRHGGKRG